LASLLYATHATELFNDASEHVGDFRFAIADLRFQKASVLVCQPACRELAQEPQNQKDEQGQGGRPEREHQHPDRL
jgi:hypothetical protein